jgi:hypothetical protein
MNIGQLTYSLFLLAGAVLLPVPVQATAQIPDQIIYDGQTLPLFSNPLATFLARNKALPTVFEEGFHTTACQRGYVATWEIRDRMLYLKKIEKEYVIDGTEEMEWREIPLTLIFPDTSGPVPADWYSGILRIPLGKRLLYVHSGYASIYEKELHMEITSGMVREILEIDNRNHPDLKDPDRFDQGSTTCPGRRASTPAR